MIYVEESVKLNSENAEQGDYISRSSLLKSLNRFAPLVNDLIMKESCVDISNRWIPVEERLPANDYSKHWKDRKHYLVCLQNGLIRVATYGYKEYGWWCDSHDCVLSEKSYTKVTHWMLAPEPYQQKGSEGNE